MSLNKVSPAPLMHHSMPMMDGNAVAVACERLTQRGALTYSPSLSWAVHDALFSYWRLSCTTRHAIAAKVPTFLVLATPHVNVHVDWDGFYEVLQHVRDAADDARDVHAACSLALHAEAAFDAGILPNLLEKRLATDDSITHHAVLRPLLQQLDRDQGEYYAAFVVLITVLEKALYDFFYAREDASTAAADGEARTTTTPPAAKKKNMILRDLLRSPVLEKALPAGLMELLRILFLPSGLNLRNLVWHGFLIPAQFPRCFACLTVALLLELPRFSVSRHSVADPQPLFQLQAFNDRFLVPERLLDQFKETVDLQTLVQSCENSTFVPTGREALVRRALDRLVTHSDELFFLMALLPVLEHALRVAFVAANTSEHGLALQDFCVAQIDQYYSTLDGFGQRDKHQVLLHPDVASSETSTLNALYKTMPRAALAVCLDLFMMASGPNVRAKLCHGEADLSTLLASTGEARGLMDVSMITRLVLLTWLSLCHNSNGDPDRGYAKRPRLMPKPEIVTVFEDVMVSSFHPYEQLKRKAESSRCRLLQFQSLVTRWSVVRVTALENDDGDGGSADSLSKLEFLQQDASAMDVLLQIVDKTQRIDEIKGMLQGGDGPVCASKKPKSFPEFVVVLRGKAARATSQLAHHNASCKAHGTSASVSSELSPQYERCLLALSDADGLSVSACMLDVLASIERSLESFEARLVTLATLIQDGAARTSQRRSFLNNVAFLPVFAELQTLALQLVVHQLRHLESRALQRAACSSSTDALCAKRIIFEQLQRKLLQFVTAFEGCTGSAEGAQKSAEKALQLALQFIESKPVRAALS